MKFILVWRDSLFSNLLILGQDHLHLSYEVQLLSNGCASLHLPSKSFTMRNQRNQLKISPHCSNGSSSSFLAALAALYLHDSLIVLNSDITSSKTMKILKGENYENIWFQIDWWNPMQSENLFSSKFHFHKQIFPVKMLCTLNKQIKLTPFLQSLGCTIIQIKHTLVLKNPLLNGWSLPKFLRIIPKHNCQFLIKKTELDEKWVSILAN